MTQWMLETARLKLVPFRPEHVDDLHALWTHADVRRYLWDDEVISRVLAAEVVETSEESFREHGFGLWALFQVGGDEIIGFAGLRHFGDGDEVELLYGLRPDQWGYGLATEASRAVLGHGFGLGLTEIFAGTDPPNVASLRVMDRLGFGDEHRREENGLETIYRSLRVPLTVDKTGRVEALLNPAEYRPRKSKYRRERLLGEFTKRVGDPNLGGSDRRTGVMTAFRQRALAIADYLEEHGATKASDVAHALDEPKARDILYRDVYGWFDRVSRNVYDLSPRGRREMPRWREEGRFDEPG